MRKKRVQVTRRRVTGKKKASQGRLFSEVNLPEVNRRVVTFLALIIIPLLMVFALLNWIKKPENLQIKSVEVQGDLKHLDKSTLQPIIEPFIKTNLYLLDKKSLEEEVELNSWVFRHH